MAKRNWSYQWLAAAYLIGFTLLLLPSNSLAQGLSVRAPASATPGDIAIFGGAPNIISDGGAPGAGGSGIQTNGGAGLKNTLTNAILLTVSNQQGAIVVTNDPVNGINSGTNVNLDFTGVSSVNNAEIGFIGPLGLYADIAVDTVHDSGLGRPIDDELEIQSANNIALIYNGGNASPLAHLQLGGINQPGFGYWNTASNLLVAGVASPSQPMYFRCGSNAAGVLHEVDPGIASKWVGGANGTEGDLLIEYDSGTVGNIHSMPDINGATVGIDLAFSTNASGLQGTTTIQSFLNGSMNASVKVGNQQVVTTGAVVLGQDQQIVDIGGGQQLIVSPGVNGNVIVNNSGTTANFVVNDGAGNPVIFSGPGINGGPGTAIVKEGLSINSSHAATNGNDLELDGTGRGLIPTNIASGVTVSNTQLISPALFTNNTHMRVDASLPWFIRLASTTAATLTGFEQLNLTNVDGTSIPMLATNYSSYGVAFTNTIGGEFTFSMGPGDWFSFAEGSGTYAPANLVLRAH